MSYNKVTLLGNVGRDPNVREFDNGGKLAVFSMATSKKVKGEDRTQWHQVKVFGKTAEIVEAYVAKGDMILVDGELEYEEWEKDGEKKSRAVITVGFGGGVSLIGKRSGPTPTVRDADRAEGIREQQASRGGADIDDDEIPF
jgi:single-strand DNA-binding protein